MSRIKQQKPKDGTKEVDGGPLFSFQMKNSKDLGEPLGTLDISHVNPSKSFTIGFIYLQAGMMTVTVNIWICAKQLI